jgi:hypothetical protein
MQYEREKKKVSNEKGNNQFAKVTHQNDAQPNESKHPTASRLAEQHGVSRPTIERDAIFSKAIDTITANTALEIKHKMLNGEID